MGDLNFSLLVFIPSVIAILAFVLILWKKLDNDLALRKMEMFALSKQITIPMRLQAYERILLFLERISPDSLLLRVRQSNMDNKALHITLLTAVRQEFEHNLSQQLYMSADAWAAVRAAKDGIQAHINECATQVDPDGASIDLARLVVETYVTNNQKGLIDNASALLKKEVKQIF